jgi:hypothetical protein
MNAELSPKIAGFEKYFIGIIALFSGFVLIYLSISGPFFLDIIKYKTSLSSISQIKGQDLINLFILSPLLLIGGTALLLNKKIARYILILTPVYLIYYALSMGLGMEWGMTAYTGNCEKYMLYFIFLLIAGLLVLLYTLSVFPKNENISFNKKSLVVYSIIFVLLVSMFAMMWIKEIFEVLEKGGSAGYNQNPALFWMVRFFDLGFSIPLGYVSVYLLWTRPAESLSMQFLFYGFFMTMLTAVSSMSFVMFYEKAPDFTVSGMVLFISLTVIVCLGFLYILSALRKGKKA